MTTAVQHIVGEERAREEVLGALRRSRGRVTLGEVITATGLARQEAEVALRSLLASHRGHLEVGEAGDLVYRFDPRLVRRDERPAWERFRKAAWAALVWTFKVWIMLMLVVYFILFLILLLTMLVAAFSSSREGGRRRSSSSGSGRGGSGIGLDLLLLLFRSTDTRYRSNRAYFGDRSYADRSEAPKVPFYKKVFAFVFGPDEPARDPLVRDRRILQLLHARRGVLTALDLVELTGLPLAEAEEEMGRLLGGFGGDVEVTDDGTIAYVFPEVMVRAEDGAGVPPPPPSPAWENLETPRLLTGNTGGTNAVIAFFNGFNLVMSGVAPTLFLPALELQGFEAELVLHHIPFTFSALFFAIPLFRALGVVRENRERRRRNVRRLVLGEVFEGCLSGPGHVVVDEVVRRVQGRLAALGQKVRPAVIEGEMRAVAAEFSAEVEAEGTGGLRYAFPRLVDDRRGARAVADRLRLDERRVGEIVFSSADDTPRDGGN